MLSEENRQSLIDFSERSDKAHALYFVGRQDIITGIEKTTVHIEKLIANRSPAEIAASGINLSDQLTWLVQGAPGAGKTALHSHLELTWVKQEDKPIAIRMDTGDLEDEASLTELIANRIRKDGAALLNRIRGLELGVGFRWFGLGADVKTTESEQQRALTLRDLWRLYDERFSGLIKDQFPDHHQSMPSAAKLQPVVLMIDEIQNLRPEGEELLEHLHLGNHGLPIFMVLAGLAWSRTRLRQAGVSRFAKGHVRTLGPLAGAEAADAVRMMLEAHDIAGFRDGRIAEKIAMWSDGWPQHLHNYMCALAWELVKKDGELAEVDVDKVRTVGDGDRNIYYSERVQDSSIVDCVTLLADIAEQIGESGCNGFQLLKLLDNRMWANNKHRASVMPKKMEPEEFIAEMTRAGIIHREDERITIPIPSFRQHLIDRGKRI